MTRHLIAYCNLALKNQIRIVSSSELEAFEKGYFSATALYNLNVREDQIKYLMLSNSIRSELGLASHQSWIAKLRYDALDQKVFLRAVIEKLSLEEESPSANSSELNNVESIIQTYIPATIIKSSRVDVFKQILGDRDILSGHYKISSFYDLEFFIRGLRESLQYRNMHEVIGLHDSYLKLFMDLKIQTKLEYFIAKRLNVSPVSTFGQMLDYYAGFEIGYDHFLSCLDGYIGDPRN